MVFTCLSHDIVAHETTHALLDGMHRQFTSRNPDVLAFHEAFADIVALFQHFSQPEVLRHQIAGTRGDLAQQNLLGELAQQFGQAIGNRGALRDAIGQRCQRRADYATSHGAPRPGRDPGGGRVRRLPDHLRGAMADLLRIATGGTGVLPGGASTPTW